MSTVDDLGDVEQRERSLATAKDRTAALQLNELMSEISEDRTCAGWLLGLEYDLWRIIEGDSRANAFEGLTPYEAARLGALRERAGGWWYSDKEHGELFETTEAFTRRFEVRNRDD